MEPVLFDTGVCRLTAIKKAALKFTDRFHIAIHYDGCTATVELTPTVPNLDIPYLVGELRNAVLDQELRELVSEETAPIRNVIIAQAFSRTSLISPDHERDDYKNHIAGRT
jgi:His-Xaa-Ser system protein HxsD